MKVSSSAPGKVILFGEHAVVYNVTAVAAALSDLRIHVDIDIEPSSDNNAAIKMLLHDIKGEDGESSYCKRIDLNDIKQMFATPPAGSSAYEAVNPDESAIARLRAGVNEANNANAAQCLMAICYLLGCILPEFVWGDDSVLNIPSKSLMKLAIRSIGLPIGAGLGSSAAFSVALSGALLRTRCLAVKGETLYSTDIADPINGVVPPSQLLPILNKWAYAAEVVIHGAPSGLDNTTSCFGGAVRFKRDEGTFDVIPKLPDLDILLTNTKVPRSTKLLVAGVRVLHDKVPTVVKPILASIEAISSRFLEIVSNSALRGDSIGAVEEEVGVLMDVNHELLNALGVGHPSLTAVREVSRVHGCSCKLTGAGGGGCAITLLPSSTGTGGSADSAERLALALEQAGFETFRSSIGGRGVKWHS